ncbi:MAG: response regulator [Planctomycetota bacterium]
MRTTDILLIDDEPLVLRTVKRRLSDAGFTVATTSCTSEARELLRRFSFGVILCDHNMPGETGLEFLTEIRAQYPTIRCFMLSGLAAGMQATESWATRIGVEKIFQKPCDTDEIIREIDRSESVF